MRDECAEEANIADPALLAELRPVSCVSYQVRNVLKRVFYFIEFRI